MVGISGASGSGKTTLAAELARTMGGLHFSLDPYYRDLSQLPMEERSRVNFDDPAMIELPLLVSHIEALSQGRSIMRPGYSFAEYIRVPEQNEIIDPGPPVVVEGLFALYFSELRSFYQLSVYVDTADDLCFQRRLKRDVEERGRKPESVRRQYDATVRPCGLAFVRPLADVADLSIDGADQLDFKVEQIRNAMKRRGLLSRIGVPIW
jgi:uridine kinase